MIVVNEPMPRSCHECFCGCDIISERCTLLQESIFGKEYDEKRRDDCPLRDLEKVLKEVHKI